MVAALPAPDAERPILPWRLVVGAFLHFILPAWLIGALAWWQLALPGGETAGQVLRALLPFSGWFLLVYAALTLFGALAAAGLDPLLRARRTRRLATDPAEPARRSAARLAAALRDGKHRFGADAALAALAKRHWDHADPRFQALSTDLAEVVRRSGDALARATPAGRPAIAELARAAIDHVDQGVTALEGEARNQAESEARTVARYVELRYGGSDFSGEGD